MFRGGAGLFLYQVAEPHRQGVGGVGLGGRSQPQGRRHDIPHLLLGCRAVVGHRPLDLGGCVLEYRDALAGGPDEDDGLAGRLPKEEPGKLRSPRPTKGCSTATASGPKMAMRFRTWVWSW